MSDSFIDIIEHYIFVENGLFYLTFNFVVLIRLQA